MYERCSTSSLLLYYSLELKAVSLPERLIRQFWHQLDCFCLTRAISDSRLLSSQLFIIRRALVFRTAGEAAPSVGVQRLLHVCLPPQRLSLFVVLSYRDSLLTS